MKIGFDNEKYLKIQSEHIKERISQFDGKLYLELGGKLFDDHHARQSFAGVQPDSNLRMFQKISDSIEIVIVISAADIREEQKKRATWALHTMRTCYAFVVNSKTVVSWWGLLSSLIIMASLPPSPSNSVWSAKASRLTAIISSRAILIT